MISLAAHDDALSGMQCAEVPSQLDRGVRYRLDRVLGVGGMGVAFLALRVAPEGEAPVVLKVVKPSVVRGSGRAANLLVSKEAVALGRLNERIPPTPFVVRFIDTGAIEANVGSSPVTLPWVAVEYVHGGPEGTTLEQRVRFSVEHTGAAFDPDRAARAIEALAAGLAAIHEVGVIHRDLTPGNVLCCGAGEDEVFKIADFGVARPSGMMATFGGIAVGTPGYASPEQFGADPSAIGAASDVFGFACVIHYLLTGEHYFRVSSPAQGIMAVSEPARSRIADAATLCEELRDRPSACVAVDAELAHATALDPLRRPQNASALAQLVGAALRPPSRMRPSERHYPSLVGSSPTIPCGWQWTIRHNPGGHVVVRSVAWDGDGRSLAATDHGLRFWNGTSWLDAPRAGLPPAEQIRVVRKLSAGLWLVGGANGYLAVYGRDGVQELLTPPDRDVTFEAASGDMADLGVLVGARAGEPPLLYGMCGRRWLRPARLSRAASVSSLARLHDEKWLVTGRTSEQTGFVARYRPLMWDVSKESVPEARAYVASAAHTESGVVVIAGTDGRALRFEGNDVSDCVVPGEPHLSAVALDEFGRCWVASTGKLWLQSKDRPQDWSLIWSDSAWSAPVVSLFAGAGSVIAMSADGGILEGRLGAI